MVSIGPYQSYMYNVADFRKKNQKNISYLPANTKNTLMGVIENTPDFSIFASIVKKSRFAGKLSDKQSDYTIFVPSDEELKKKYNENVLNNIDDGLAKQIISFSMMNRKIDKQLLQSSQIAIFPTIDRTNSMHLHTINEITYLPNNTTIIHFNQPADNGIIHVIDNILIPEKTI